MPAANVPIIIDQGEDWTVQLIWTDNYDEPQNVLAPCRMDVKHTLTGQTMFSLFTPTEELPPGEIPPISLSSEIGMIQLHVPRATTEALIPGQYHYDLFASVDDGDVYAGNQVQRILYGSVIVNKRVTHL